MSRWEQLCGWGWSENVLREKKGEGDREGQGREHEDGASRSWNSGSEGVVGEDAFHCMVLV